MPEEGTIRGPTRVPAWHAMASTGRCGRGGAHGGASTAVRGEGWTRRGRIGGRGGVVGGGGRGGAGPRWAAGAVAWWLSGAARVLGRLVPENTRCGCGRVPSEAA